MRQRNRLLAIDKAVVKLRDQQRKLCDEAQAILDGQVLMDRQGDRYKVGSIHASPMGHLEVHGQKLLKRPDRKGETFGIQRYCGHLLSLTIPL